MGPPGKTVTSPAATGRNTKSANANLPHPCPCALPSPLETGSYPARPVCGSTLSCACPVDRFYPEVRPSLPTPITCPGNVLLAFSLSSSPHTLPDGGRIFPLAPGIALSVYSGERSRGLLRLWPTCLHCLLLEPHWFAFHGSQRKAAPVGGLGPGRAGPAGCPSPHPRPHPASPALTGYLDSTAAQGVRQRERGDLEQASLACHGLPTFTPGVGCHSIGTCECWR